MSLTQPNVLITALTRTDIVAMWNEMKILNAVMKNKLLFVETTDPVESTIALENYKKACDTGRGAVLFSVARGIFFFSNVLLIFPAFQQCLR